MLVFATTNKNNKKGINLEQLLIISQHMGYRGSYGKFMYNDTGAGLMRHQASASL